MGEPQDIVFDHIQNAINGEINYLVLMFLTVVGN